MLLDLRLAAVDEPGLDEPGLDEPGFDEQGDEHGFILQEFGFVRINL